MHSFNKVFQSCGTGLRSHGSLKQTRLHRRPHLSSVLKRPVSPFCKKWGLSFEISHFEQILFIGMSFQPKVRTFINLYSYTSSLAGLVVILEATDPARRGR